jgi:hypothetical protein
MCTTVYAMDLTMLSNTTRPSFNCRAMCVQDVRQRLRALSRCYVDGEHDGAKCVIHQNDVGRMLGHLIMIWNEGGASNDVLHACALTSDPARPMAMPDFHTYCSDDGYDDSVDGVRGKLKSDRCQHYEVQESHSHHRPSPPPPRPAPMRHRGVCVSKS